MESSTIFGVLYARLNHMLHSVSLVIITTLELVRWAVRPPRDQVFLFDDGPCVTFLDSLILVRLAPINNVGWPFHAITRNLNASDLCFRPRVDNCSLVCLFFHLESCWCPLFWRCQCVFYFQRLRTLPFGHSFAEMGSQLSFALRDTTHLPSKVVYNLDHVQCSFHQGF